MKEPIWWLKKMKPLSIDKCWMPKICATAALVGGTVDSHSVPITAEKMYTLSGVSGAAIKIAITSARPK